MGRLEAVEGGLTIEPVTVTVRHQLCPAAMRVRATGHDGRAARAPGRRRAAQPRGALDPARPAGSRGGQVVRAVPGRDGCTPGRLPSEPGAGGLSVKVRAGAALEVKVHHGSPGILDMPGRARGRIPSWQKWSFPLRPPGLGAGEPAGWTVIRKKPGSPASRDARWNLPRSAPAARPGGRWDSRRPAGRPAPQRTAGHRRADFRRGPAACVLTRVTHGVE